MTPASVLSGETRWCLVHADNAAVLPTLPDMSVAHVVTDPPYTQRTSNNARTNAHGGGFVTFDGVDGTEVGIASRCLRVAERWVLIFCALEQLGTYAVAPEWIRSGIWVRTNSVPQFTGDRPGQGCEGLAILHRKGRKRWRGGGHPATWIGETANSFGEYDGRQGDHPTPKPLWLMLELVEAFTDPDEIVLDPFAGSGTTGVACLRLGRRFIGIERDEKYAAAATERLAAESKGLDLRAARAGQLSLLGDS